jgi:hypothetical protein
MKRLAGVLAILAFGLASCTGVPSSSAPQTIEALDTGGASNTPVPPPDLSGLGARDIVDRFIHATATSTGNPALARAFLTPEAAAQWPGSGPTATTATIIANDYTVSTENRNHTVTVSGRVLGTLSADGIYTPSLQGDGQGGAKVPFVFSIARFDSQFRIAKPPTGLLLTDDDFRDAYRQQQVYFYDLTGKTLVPDVRWTSLVDKQQLAEWLLAEIVNGPRSELQGALSADTMPAESDPRQIRVTLGAPTKIEIPGADLLPSDTRNQLAAQLSETLLETLAGGDITITDGGRPVRIPIVGGTVFAASDFASAIGPRPIVAEVYYLDGSGRIRDDAGKPLTGIDGSLAFSSFALGRAAPGEPLLVAGVTGTGSAARLSVGTAGRGGLHPAHLAGPLTRPAFVPGRSEVWIGSGGRLYRVLADAPAGSRPERVPLPGNGQILALRFSPEGSRIAIVIAGGDGRARLYVGSVVRAAGPPRIDKLQPISPHGVVVKDVAWLDPLKLFAIGWLAASQDSRTFETGVDGTDWTNSTTGLPSPPDAVAAATAASVWASAGGFVWKQSGTSWVSPGTTGQTPGTAPIYVE